MISSFLRIIFSELCCIYRRYKK